MFSGKNAENLIQMVQERYKNSLNLIPKYFEDVELMRLALNADLNQTSQQMCGTYLGRF